MDPYSHPEDRKVRVSIEASDYRCEGFVHLPGVRLSDVMNDKNQFLIVVKAVIRKKVGGEDRQSVEMDTLLINKNDIKFLLPRDEPRTSIL